MTRRTATARLGNGLRAALSLAAVLSTVLATQAGAALAAPSDGTAWIVSIGDSAISGEAGRWAGNTEADPVATDALGPSAYFDNPARTAERIAGCHRSRSAEVHIGDGTASLNLACSGAQTGSLHNGGEPFKPGLDFYHGGAGRQSQLVMLRDFASTHRVKAIAVLIGANNYRFADIVQTCVLDWYLSPAWAQHHCQDDPSMTADFSPQNVAAQTAEVTKAFRNVRDAMAQAGHPPNSYTVIAQTYSSPIPGAAGFRHPEAGHARAAAGCAVWDADADWVRTTVVPTLNDTIRKAATASGLTNIKLLEAQNALAGHRLCEKGTGELEDTGLAAWTDPRASDRTEWVQQVRTLTTLFGPYQLQEDGHPSYWGQLALRNCLRQAYNNGNPRSGQCTPASGRNTHGEPAMLLK